MWVYLVEQITVEDSFLFLSIYVGKKNGMGRVGGENKQNRQTKDNKERKIGEHYTLIIPNTESD